MAAAWQFLNQGDGSMSRLSIVVRQISAQFLGTLVVLSLASSCLWAQLILEGGGLTLVQEGPAAEVFTGTWTI